jgi:hypothetical protein
MSGAVTGLLPTVITSSVIRSTDRGQSHGGVFLVDLATGEFDQVIDWNDGSIDWAGRGGDRGLRGIAFDGERVYLAASDEIFVFDRDLRQVGSIRSLYLKHCHEICIRDGALHLTSTGFDAILSFDLRRWSFIRGICMRPFRMTGPTFTRLRLRKGLGRRLAKLDPRFYRGFTLNLRPRAFNPERDGGPEPMDMLHINNVAADAAGITISGTELDGLFRVHPDRLERLASVPLGTHNAALAAGLLLFQDTGADQVVLAPPGGRAERFPLPQVGRAQLDHAEVGADHARPAFGRGLCITEDGLLIAGSSPATITVFRRGRAEPVASVMLTRDVRNAIHGLEVWPFDRRLADWRARCGRAPAERAPAAARAP